MEEEWCHYFSSCFLLPIVMLQRMMGGSKRNYVYINELINVKEYFGISIHAIVYRLQSEEIITETYYKRCSVYMNKAYGHKSEPGEYKGEEKSKGFDQLIARGLSEGMISLSKAAALRKTDINQLRKDYVSIP